MKNFEIVSTNLVSATNDNEAGKIVTIVTSDLSNANLDRIAEETGADVLIF